MPPTPQTQEMPQGTSTLQDIHALAAEVLSAHAALQAQTRENIRLQDENELLHKAVSAQLTIIVQQQSKLDALQADHLAERFAFTPGQGESP